MESLKSRVREYRDIEKELTFLNKSILTLRQKRRTIEEDLSQILSEPKFHSFDRLRLEDDGSIIRVQRPETWNKPWSLSKTDLEEHVHNYFKKTETPTSDGCIDFITQMQKQNLVSKEFKFTLNIEKE